MLKRDQYRGDYTIRYYTQISQRNFQNDLKKNSKHLDLILLEEKDLNLLQAINNLQGTGYFILLSFSLLLVVGLKKLPFINKIKNQWLVFGLQSSIFFGPSYVFYRYIELQKELIKWKEYITYFEKYKVYKQTGDVKSLNDNVRLE